MRMLLLGVVLLGLVGCQGEAKKAAEEKRLQELILDYLQTGDGRPAVPGALSATILSKHDFTYRHEPTLVVVCEVKSRRDVHMGGMAFEKDRLFIERHGFLVLKDRVIKCAPFDANKSFEDNCQAFIAW